MTHRRASTSTFEISNLKFPIPIVRLRALRALRALRGFYPPSLSQEPPMSVTILYHGHSNLEILSGPHRIQLDPFYTGNGLADIPAEKASPTHILLSHAHGDHTGDVISIAK